MLCRSEKRMKIAKDKILLVTPGARLTLIKMDLASYDSVRVAAVELMKKVDSIDILILNAGVVTTDSLLLENVHATQGKIQNFKWL
jgi:short-subunit dehydrogenase